ncbi:hypothetical protein ABG067_009442, partial [Albugo candida]
QSAGKGPDEVAQGGMTDISLSDSRAPVACANDPPEVTDHRKLRDTHSGVRRIEPVDLADLSNCDLVSDTSGEERENSVARDAAS